MPSTRFAFFALLTVSLLVSTAACDRATSADVVSERPTPALYAALDTLLLAERRAESRYGQVLRAFGKVDPFALFAEEQSGRTSSLERIYLEYGALPPANPFAGMAQPYVAYAALSDACAETLNETVQLVALYDRALTLRPPATISRVWMQNRQQANAETIPAAARCR